MQKRRSLLFFSAIIAILLLLVLLLFLDPWNLRKGESGQISLRNTQEVDRIVLAGPFSTVELNKVEGIWYLFGTEEVSAVTVENLLFAASRFEVGSITELEVFEEAADAQEDIRELSFFSGDRVRLDFRMIKHRGRYLVNPGGSDRAFYVSLPGYPDLDLERVFSATPDHYREHLLIDLLPSDIASIEIELASGEAFGFTQDREGNILCRVANDSTRMPEGAPNELAMKLLFSYFTSIRYEQRTGIRADSLLESEMQHQKMATVRVESFDGERHSLQVFPYHEFPGSEPHLFRALVLHNQDQEALIINYIYLDVLMRGLSHYIGEK